MDKSILLTKIISLSLKAVLIIMFFYAIYLNDFSWAFFAIIMVFIVFIPNLIRYYLKIVIPYIFDVFICLALIFHMGNGLFNVCACVPLYNKFTHFFSATVIAFIALTALFVANEYHKGISSPKMGKILFDVIVITMALGVVWEFLEWTTDYFFGFNTQPSLNDTIGDLFADTLGGILTAFFGYYLIKRGHMKKMAKNIRKKIDVTKDKLEIKK